LAAAVLLHEILGSGVNGIEFSDFVRVAYSLKEIADVLPEPRKHEVEF
jgi:hypothetical protein